MASDFGGVPASMSGLSSGGADVSSFSYGLQPKAANPMASGYGSDFAAKLRRDGGGGSVATTPVHLVVFFLGSIFLSYNAGYFATLSYHHGAGSESLANSKGLNAAGIKKCNARISSAQTGFFASHACWFNISRRPDWVATRLFFQSRATAMKKGLTAPGADDKCGFISIGTGTYDANPTLMAAYASDPEAGAKLNLDDYVLNMKASSVFDQCYTFTYTTEKNLPLAQSAMAGIKQALVRPLWTDAHTTLDTEFNKIVSSVVEGTIFVKSHLRSYESDMLAGFKTGLASGRVGALVWERAVLEAVHVRSLKDEVEFVSSFGYAVYLASAEEAEMNQQFQRVYTPSVYVRMDRGLWDNIYSVANANLVLTMVAVQQSHPFRVFLDSSQALCPILVDKFGNPTCECMLENYAAAPDNCALASLVGQKPFFMDQFHGGHNPLHSTDAEWRQPLAQAAGKK